MKRTALDCDIQAWRVMQLVHTPCVSMLDTDSRSANVNAEDIPLLLPSALPEALHDSIKDAVKTEKQLGEAQADDALNEIRRQRRLLYSVYQFKKLNVSGTGNKPNTRICSIFERVNVKIQWQVARYRVAYGILLTLDPQGLWTLRLCELADTDVRGPGREAGDTRNSYFEPSWIWLTPSKVAMSADSSSTLTTHTTTAMPSASSHQTCSSTSNPPTLSTPSTQTAATATPSASGRQTRSSGTESMLPYAALASKEFNKTMRIEWSKSRARLQRWEEEVDLVVEEMRRVLVLLDWKKGWWYE